MDDYNDDSEVCRVCRTEAEPGNPLYHPCKCSGSIRYVHSECLVQWLGHSNKKNCELCGHAFSFKKVYPADMPPSLPLHTLALHFLKDSMWTIGYVGWAVLVAVAWLIILPLIIKGVWGGLFSGGDSMVGKMVGGNANSTQVPAFNRTETSEDLKEISAWLSTGKIDPDDIAAEVAERMSKGERAPRSRVSWVDGLWAIRATFYDDPKVRSLVFKTMGYQMRNYIRDTLLTNVFQGQILSVIVVITFLGVFLVREWVIQNGPIENPAADAPEMGGPARPEDFRPHMAVRWRLRPGMDRHGMDRFNTNELEALVQQVQQRLDDFGPLTPQSNAADGGTASPRNEHEEDDEWEDEPDEDASVTAMMERDQGAAFPRNQDYDDEAEVDDVFPMEADLPDSPNLDAMREARNRYFAVADHNRHFADQAPDVSGAASASSVLRPSYQSDFTFNFNVDDNDQAGPAGSSLQRGGSSGPGSGDGIRSVWLPTEVELPPSRPDSSLQVDQAARQPLFPPEIRNRPEDPARAEAPRRRGERARQARGVRGAQRRQRRQEDEIVQGVEERWNDFDADDAVEGEGFILEGDIEGAMEVVGLRGPPIVLLQNTFIVVLVLTAALTVFVHVPYVLGRIHLVGDISMLSIPARGLFAVAKGITLMTDFMITGLAKVLDYMLIHPLGVVLGLSPKEPAESGFPGPTKQSTPPLTALFGLVKKGLEYAQRVSPALIGSRIGQVSDLAESIFASLGANYLKYKEITRELAAQNSTTSRLMCVAMGYVDAIGTIVFLSALGEPVLGKFGKSIAEAAASHGTVLKLGFFMLVELAFFPMSMGYIVDLCALPLFPAGTLSARLAVQQRHPLLSFFAHWLCGTLFMFAFAKFLSSCRAVCRRGAMYMIRDPQDPSFSPVRDILDKSTFLQMQKLLISAFMYIAVLVGPIGGLFMAIRLLPVNLLPLRWYYKETPSTVPYDFILMLFYLPIYWRQLRLGRWLRHILNIYWRSLAKTLRLSSYFYGVRHEEEEVEGPIERKLLAVHKKWITLKRVVTRSKAAHPNYEGRQMRVPYADSVALVKPRRNVFIEVDLAGVPTTDEGKVTAVLQDRVGRKAHRRVREDYTQVYMPGLYPLRFWIFGMSLWVMVAWTCMLGVLAPIVIGRGLTRIWFGYQVHDGYSFFAGVMTMKTLVDNAGRLLRALGYLRKKGSGHSVPDRLQTETDHMAGDTPRPRPYAGRLVRSFASFVILPVTVGLLLDLYILFPLKYGFSDMTPVFYASEAWAFGFLVSSIIYYRASLWRQVLIFLAHAYGEEELAREDSTAWLETVHQGHYPVRPAIAYLGKWLGAALVGPGLIALVGSVGLGLDARTGSLFFRFIYPSILSIYLLKLSSSLAVEYLKIWSVRALESFYLVEKRVMNMEEAEQPGSEVTVREAGLRAEDVAQDNAQR